MRIVVFCHVATVAVAVAVAVAVVAMYAADIYTRLRLLVSLRLPCMQLTTSCRSSW